jgi:hypothetical protein
LKLKLKYKNYKKYKKIQEIAKFKKKLKKDIFFEKFVFLKHIRKIKDKK